MSKSNKKSHRVCGVVLAYNPDLKLLASNLEEICRQVEKVVVVDNASDSPVVDFGPAVSIIRNNKNLGTAGGFNKGVSWAQERDFTHVLFFDHDSLPHEGMVNSLLEVNDLLIQGSIKVAAVGPSFLDIRSSKPAPFIQFSGFRLIRMQCSGCAAKYHEASYLISSGTLISLKALQDIGGMDERLFIDYVDIEWGLRAYKKGWRCYGACCAKMKHQLGDRVIRFWLLRWREVPYHSPERHYYLFRNAMFLYRQNWVPYTWKINDAYRLFLKFLFYSMVTYPRHRHLRMMSLGLWHGLTGKMGRNDSLYMKLNRDHLKNATEHENRSC